MIIWVTFHGMQRYGVICRQSFQASKEFVLWPDTGLYAGGLSISLFQRPAHSPMSDVLVYLAIFDPGDL
jgi:hypothetical protein